VSLIIHKKTTKKKLTHLENAITFPMKYFFYYFVLHAEIENYVFVHISVLDYRLINLYIYTYNKIIKLSLFNEKVIAFYKGYSFLAIIN